VPPARKGEKKSSAKFKKMATNPSPIKKGGDRNSEDFVSREKCNVEERKWVTSTLELKFSMGKERAQEIVSQEGIGIRKRRR